MINSILKLDGAVMLKKETQKLINGKGAYAFCLDGQCAPNGQKPGYCINDLCYTEESSGGSGSGGCNQVLLPDGTIGCL